MADGPGTPTRVFALTLGFDGQSYQRVVYLSSVDPAVDPGTVAGGFLTALNAMTEIERDANGFPPAIARALDVREFVPIIKQP